MAYTELTGGSPAPVAYGAGRAHLGMAVRRRPQRPSALGMLGRAATPKPRLNIAALLQQLLGQQSPNVGNLQQRVTSPNPSLASLIGGDVGGGGFNPGGMNQQTQAPAASSSLGAIHPVLQPLFANDPVASNRLVRSATPTPRARRRPSIRSLMRLT